MKKQESKKLILSTVIGISAALLLTACGSEYSNSVTNAYSKTEAAYSPAYAGDAYYDSSEGFMSNDMAVSEEAGELSESASVNRKLIRNANLDVETKNYEELINAVRKGINKYNGYIESMNEYNGNAYYSYRDYKSCSMRIRIPQNHLDAFLGEISEVSNVIQRSESVEDITLSYVDTESKVNSLKVEQTRLLELLEKAESLDDILAIEDRLSTVRYQLESYASQLRTMDNQVDYSTVYLSISEVTELTPVEEETVWERISGGFTESLHDVGDGLVNFVVWFIVNLPHIVVWAVVIFIIVVILRLIFRKKGSKADRKTKKNRKDKAEDISKQEESNETQQ